MRARLAAGATSDQDDAGMTLIEVMVAMLVLTVVLSALASVLITSLQALHGQENRTRANALANDLLEELKERDWEVVGFWDQDHGFREAVDADSGEPCADVEAAGCEATVALYDDESQLPEGDRPLPLRDGEGGDGTDPVVRDGIEYEVRTDITWVDDDDVTGSENYKRFTVELTWSDIGRERTVRHQTKRTPTHGEQLPGELRVRSRSASPGYGYLRSTGSDNPRQLMSALNRSEEPPQEEDLDGGVELHVETLGSADGVEVSYWDYTDPDEPIKNTQTMEPVGGSDTEWEYTATNGWRYANGEVTFTFEVIRDGDVIIRTNQVVTYVFREVAFRDDPVVLDDAGEPTEVVCVDDANVVQRPVDVGVHVHGLIRHDLVTVDGGGFEEAAAERGEETSSGKHFGVEIPEGHQVPDGEVLQLTLTGQRLLDEGVEGGHDVAVEELVLDVAGEDDERCA